MRSTALRFAALKGKIRFFEEGRITPLPSSIIPGGTDVKSSCFKNDDERVTPLLFLIDDSTFRLTFPSNLLVGKMLITFEFMLIVVSIKGVK